MRQCSADPANLDMAAMKLVKRDGTAHCYMSTSLTLPLLVISFYVIYVICLTKGTVTVPTSKHTAYPPTSGKLTLPSTNQQSNTSNMKHVQTSKNASKSPKQADTHIGNRERMAYVLERAYGLLYAPKGRVVLMLMAKAGSSTMLAFVYKSSTGREWNGTRCGTLHNRTSACWRNIIIPVAQLPPQKQWNVLTDTRVLRVAVQRNPYDRLLSAYKSKYTCQAERFHTHVPNRDKIVPRMRNALHMRPKTRTCMGMTEFGRMLDIARLRAGMPGYVKMKYLDNHIMPQQFFGDDLHFNVVMQISDMAVDARRNVIASRFPFSFVMGPGFVSRFASGNATLYVPEGTKESIRLFSKLSRPLLLTYL